MLQVAMGFSMLMLMLKKKKYRYVDGCHGFL